MIFLNSLNKIHSNFTLKQKKYESMVVDD